MADARNAPLFPYIPFLPHFRLYGVAWLHVCVLPYKYRNILQMLHTLMKLCDIMRFNGEQAVKQSSCRTESKPFLRPRSRSVPASWAVVGHAWGRQRPSSAPHLTSSHPTTSRLHSRAGTNPGITRWLYCIIYHIYSWAVTFSVSLVTTVLSVINNGLQARTCSFPHFLFYEVVSVIRWVIPYKCLTLLDMLLTLLDMLLKLIDICEKMGRRRQKSTPPAKALAKAMAVQGAVQGAATGAVQGAVQGAATGAVAAAFPQA